MLTCCYLWRCSGWGWRVAGACHLSLSISVLRMHRMYVPPFSFIYIYGLLMNWGQIFDKVIFFSRRSTFFGSSSLAKEFFPSCSPPCWDKLHPTSSHPSLTPLNNNPSQGGNPTFQQPQMNLLDSGGRVLRGCFDAWNWGIWRMLSGGRWRENGSV